MAYLFDTDTLSATMRRTPHAGVVRRLAVTPVDLQFTSAVTLGELVYGARRRGRDDLLDWVLMIPDLLTVVPFDAAVAERFGLLKAQLEREGALLADADLRIAASALEYDLTLVTGNVRHFSRIPDLRVENWIDPAGE